jgi:hypothetical protein
MHTIHAPRPAAAAETGRPRSVKAALPRQRSATAAGPVSPRRDAREDVVASTHWTRCLYWDPVWPKPPRRRRPLLASGLALLALYVVLHLTVGGAIELVRWLGESVPGSATVQARVPQAPAVARH